MSLKPKKISETKNDQVKLNDKMKRKQKTLLDPLPPYTLIISEGVKTEVSYIKGFADAINKKHADQTKARIRVIGTGRNCLSLLREAQKIITNIIPQPEAVWLMYDKDNFPPDNFDNTENSAKKKKGTCRYNVAWSNECIELWFVLHFQELNANVGREKYVDILKKYCDYSKNAPNLYDLMKENTDIAINRAKKQYNKYPDDTAPSKRCPSTRVFELVENLKKYL